jgi:hypothetical protein
MAIARIWRNAHERAVSRVRDGMLTNNALIAELCRKVQNESLTDTDYRSYARERLTSWMENRRSGTESRAAQARAVLKTYSCADQADHCSRARGVSPAILF